MYVFATALKHRPIPFRTNLRKLEWRVFSTVVVKTRKSVRDVYLEIRFLRSLYAIAVPSVVCLSSVTFVRPTPPVENFGSFSSPFGTLAIL